MLKVKGSLLHQINNPLSVVNTLSKEDQLTPEKMEMLRRNVERVSKVMDALHKVDKLSDLELQQYTNQVDVYLVKDDQTQIEEIETTTPTKKIS